MRLEVSLHLIFIGPKPAQNQRLFLPNTVASPEKRPDASLTPELDGQQVSQASVCKTGPPVGPH